MPTASRQRPVAAASSSMRTPRCSSTSAPPKRPDAARLPCFATAAPAPAATSAAAVEMLNVLQPSPPVPQLSISGPAVRRHPLGVRAQGARAGDHDVDGLAAHAQRREETADQRRRCGTAHDLLERGCRFFTGERAAFRRGAPAPRAAGTGSRGLDPGEEVREQLLAAEGQDRLGMELHASSGQLV